MDSKTVNNEFHPKFKSNLKFKIAPNSTEKAISYQHKKAIKMQTNKQTSKNFQHLQIEKRIYAYFDHRSKKSERQKCDIIMRSFTSSKAFSLILCFFASARKIFFRNLLIGISLSRQQSFERNFY